MSSMAGWNHMMSSGGMFMWLILLIAIGVVIYIAMQASRNRDFQGSSSAGPGTKESAMDILRKRYAGGQISKEEFEAMKKDLES